MSDVKWVFLWVHICLTHLLCNNEPNVVDLILLLPFVILLYFTKRP